jgi:spore coat protein U-like protein
MRHKLLIAALLCIGLCDEADAATATGTFQVQITIQATCILVSSTNLNFGTNGVLSANINQTSTITVQCTNTTPYNIGLNAGVNGGSVTTRQMKGGPTSQLINYSLFSNAGLTQNWGQTVGTDTVAATGNGAAQGFTVFGQVPAQTTPTPGTYTDTITVTVTY